nr:MAG TPA: hypothetical protein [Caudoviricetes sp.]
MLPRLASNWPISTKAPWMPNLPRRWQKSLKLFVKPVRKALLR